MASITPLSNVDAAWLKMEDPTNLMMVSGVMTFAQPLDPVLIAEVIENRFLTFDRFRQRIVKSPVPMSPPYWEFDPNFNLSSHLHHVALPHPHNKFALQELCSDLMSTPLDFSKPLWQIHIVDGYEEGGAVIVRLHHAIADGIALVGVLLAMTDLTPEYSPMERDETISFPERSNRFGNGLSALRQRGRQAVSSSVSASRRAMIEGLETFLNVENAWKVADNGSDYVHAATKLVFRPPDPDTILKGTLGVAKRAAWSRPMPLQEVKGMRKATGATINDLMTTAITGGLRRYIMQRGESVDDVTVRAAVPVNLRKPDEMGELGNKFGLVFADLPVGLPTMKQRLKAVQIQMGKLKESPEPVVAMDILSGMGLSPQVIEDVIIRIIGAKATTVLTNVPGPPIPLYLTGRRIENIMFWVPQSGRLGLGISILSYAGNIYIGVATDEGLIPDPDSIINGFYAEYDEMLATL